MARIAFYVFLEGIDNMESENKETQEQQVPPKKTPESQQDEMTKKLLIFLCIAMVLCVVLQMWDKHSWKILYDTVETTVDERGVNHYVLHSDKHNFTFDYYVGSYEVEIFESFKKEGDDGWFYTENVEESNYAGKFLYTKLDEIEAMFEELTFDYELVYDDETQIYSHAIVYVSDYFDINDKTIKKILKSLEEMVPSSRTFSKLNRDNYGRIEFYEIGKDKRLYTKKLYLW